MGYLYLILSSVLVFFLVLPFINTFFSIFVNKKIGTVSNPKNYDFGNIITAYKNADIAKGLVESLLKQSHHNHHVYLVADNCDISDWDIEHGKLTVLCPSQPLNLKAKSIIHAAENFKRAHDFITVFDADNLAHPDFLSEINRFANAGFHAVQGQRTAKNLDTMMACADALGEFYKNYIERLVPFKIGSSAVISGSGMAVEAERYKSYLACPEIEKGKHQWKKMLQEDKILQNYLLRENHKIAYAWDAICYDEKVEDVQSVETQRGRWLFSYFQNLPNSIGHIRRGIFNFSWNQFLFGLITIAPPMFIMLMTALVLVVIGYFINPIMSVVLMGGLAIFAATIFWTLYLSKAPKEVWNAIWAIPSFISGQLKGLLKMGDPNKNFKHTEHKKHIGIEEVLK